MTRTFKLREGSTEPILRILIEKGTKSTMATYRYALGISLRILNLNIKDLYELAEVQPAKNEVSYDGGTTIIINSQIHNVISVNERKASLRSQTVDALISNETISIVNINGEDCRAIRCGKHSKYFKAISENTGSSLKIGNKYLAMQADGKLTCSVNF